MTELLIILKDIILPIFILMSIGFLMQRKFVMDIKTLARLNIFYLVPAFIFVKLYSTQFSAQLFFYIIFFLILYLSALFIISIIVGKWLKLDKGKQMTFSNGIMFFNSGNYGVPVNDLVFKSDPLAMSVQVIILTVQNIFTFSYGIFSLQSVNIGKLKAMLGYFKMPVLYAILAGVSLNVLNVSIPSFIWVPANYVAESMIAIALVTLGAQVADVRIITGLFTVYINIFIRLLIGPAIALILIFLFQMEGIIAQALLIGSAMPTSVNSAVIAAEYENHPELAAQIVLFSTLISAFTVTIIIYVARIIF